MASENGTLPLFDTYHAFEVNTTGVEVTSIKTTFPDLQIEDPRGALKFAPNGVMMASANMFDGLFLEVHYKLVVMEKSTVLYPQIIITEPPF